MIVFKVSGHDQTIRRMKRIATQMKKNMSQTTKDAAIFGTLFAKRRAPAYTGDTRNAITLNFNKRNEATIISRPGRNDFGYPVNVFFDEGALEMFKWYRNGHQPRSALSVGFMKKTNKFLERYFVKRAREGVRTAVNTS